MRRFIAAALLIAAISPSTPAHAVGASGCSVATIGSPSPPTSCQFTATGPVDFVAATTSGWRIMRSRDGGQTWTVAATSAPSEVRPTHLNVSAARLPAIRAFDIIDISIVRANESTPAGPLSYQHGFIAATSAL